MKQKILTKVIFIGGSSVGKTSLLRCYLTGTFSQQYRETIGSDFYVKEFNIDGQQVAVQFWDTAGQERFTSLGAPFYRKATCCVIVFDVTNTKSFELLDFWRNEFLGQSPDIQHPEEFPFIIIGNKQDLLVNYNEDSKTKIVESEEAEQWCQSRGNVIYLKTSCYDIPGLEKTFQIIARKSLPIVHEVVPNPQVHVQQPEQIQTEVDEQNQSIVLKRDSEGQQKQQGGCSC